MFVLDFTAEKKLVDFSRRVFPEKAPSWISERFMNIPFNSILATLDKIMYI